MSENAELAMYRVRHAPKWLCTELDMSWSGYVPKRLCPEVAMSRNGYVPKWLCPETVMSRSGCHETVMSRNVRRPTTQYNYSKEVYSFLWLQVNIREQ